MTSTSNGCKPLDNDIADLVAAVLDESDPLKFVPKPKPKRSASEIAAQFYNEYETSLEPSKPISKATALSTTDPLFLMS